MFCTTPPKYSLSVVPAVTSVADWQNRTSKEEGACLLNIVLFECSHLKEIERAERIDNLPAMIFMPRRMPLRKMKSLTQ